jgi:uncharacterized protein YciI
MSLFALGGLVCQEVFCCTEVIEAGHEKSLSRLGLNWTWLQEASVMANYYALFYDEVVENFVSQRVPFREEHLGLAREAHARGELLMAGALADPADAALLVFRTENAATAEEFAKKDPYVRNGLVKKWRVRKWTVVVGNQ